MYNSNQYCHTKSHLNKEKLSLKNSIVNSAIWITNAIKRFCILFLYATHIKL